MDELKKVRCKSIYGVWYYKIIKPTQYNDLDGAIYELYDTNKKIASTFGSYADMKYYIETGIIL